MVKIKLKDGAVLSNNWKSCGCTKEDWDNLSAGKTIEVNSVSTIKDKVDVVESASKPKQQNKNRGDK